MAGDVLYSDPFEYGKSDRSFNMKQWDKLTLFKISERIKHLWPNLLQRRPNYVVEVFNKTLLSVFNKTSLPNVFYLYTEFLKLDNFHMKKLKLTQIIVFLYTNK